MGTRRLVQSRVQEPIEVTNKSHEVKNHKIKRKSDVKLTYEEDTGKVKIAFQIEESQSFDDIRIYQSGDPHPPATIKPELPTTDKMVKQLYAFRPPALGYRWAMFLMNFNKAYGFDFKSEYTLLPYSKTLFQGVVILVTYAKRDFQDVPSKNYFDTTVTFQGSTPFGGG